MTSRSINTRPKLNFNPVIPVKSRKNLRVRDCLLTGKPATKERSGSSGVDVLRDDEHGVHDIL